MRSSWSSLRRRSHNAAVCQVLVAVAWGCEMKQIPLHNKKGYVVALASVDDDDYEYLMQWRWQLNGGYVVRSTNGQKHRMHRMLMQPPAGYCIDHINGNPFDNRRANLRICTLRENNQNATKRDPRASSKFKGVYWNSRAQKWRAQIKSDKKIHLGSFTDEVAAAKAYDVAARRLFGQFARTNFEVTR